MLTSIILLPLLPLLATALPTTPKRATTKRATAIHQIHPSSDPTKCLDVGFTTFDSIQNGMRVIVRDCLSTSTFWEVAEGENVVVKVSGTEGRGDGGAGFCLDAGTQFPADNTFLKVWSCYPGAPQQNFYVTDDAHIAVTGGTACLDTGNSGQFWDCIGYNTNQLFTLGTPSVPPPTTTIATTTKVQTTTTSAAASTTTTTVPPPSSSSVIGKLQWKTGPLEEAGCLTVNNGFAASGASIVIVGCDQSTDGAVAKLQTFAYVKNQPTKVQLVGSNLCLDAGSNPGNGGPLTVYECLDVPQQNWFYTLDDHLAITGGNQCVDIKKESGPTETKPNGSKKDTQTWQCSDVDAYQIIMRGPGEGIEI